MAAAHIHQTSVPAEIIGIQHLFGHHRLAGRHQRRIRRHCSLAAALPARRIGRCRQPLPGGRCIGPERRQLALPAPALQHGDGIGQIIIKDLVMLDHRQRALVGGKRRAALAQHPQIGRRQFHQINRLRRTQQPLHRLLGKARALRQFGGAGRPLAQAANHAGIHGRGQRLGLHETGDHREHGVGVIARRAPHQRVAHGKTLERRIGQHPIARVQPAQFPSRRGSVFSHAPHKFVSNGLDSRCPKVNHDPCGQV